MPVTISRATPGLNKANGSVSYLMLKGNGFQPPTPDSTQSASAKWTNPNSQRTFNWTGSIIWASRDGKFGLAQLTASVSSDDGPGPDEEQQVNVTVGDSNATPTSVDLYNEPTPS